MKDINTRKIIKSLIAIVVIILIMLMYVECNNKIFRIYPQNNDIELENNIVASVRHQESWIDIDIGTWCEYGLNCDFQFSFTKQPEEMKIKKIILKVPSKHLNIEKEINEVCYIGEKSGYFWFSNNNTILVDDILKYYGFKDKNPFTKTLIYWYLYNSRTAIITYEIEYKTGGNVYDAVLEYNFKMKPLTSIRWIDNALSI